MSCNKYTLNHIIKTVTIWSPVFVGRHLCLEHLLLGVCVLVQGDGGLHQADTVHHVGGHVHRVETAGRHRTHLEKRVQHTRQDLGN